MFYLNPRVVTVVDDAGFDNDVSQWDGCLERQVNPEFPHNHLPSSLPLEEDILNTLFKASL